MKNKAFDPVRVRIWALTGLMGLCLLAFAGVMYYTQILHGAVSYTHLDVYKRQIPPL